MIQRRGTDVHHVAGQTATAITPAETGDNRLHAEIERGFCCRLLGRVVLLGFVSLGALVTLRITEQLSYRRCRLRRL